MVYNLITEHTWFVYTLIGLFSLAVGSLINVIIYRLPLMMESEWKEQCCELLNIEQKNESQTVNLFFPRSFCPNCKTPIKSWQNIPLLSYLYLQGRCAACKNRISIRYPLIEIITLLLSLYATLHFGLIVQLPFILILIWMLLCLFFIDLDHQLLPDCLTISLLWLGLLANTQHLFTSLPDAVLSAVAAYLCLWSFIKLFYLITGKIGMGNGDFKLLAVFGAWFGWTLFPLILLIAAVSGAIGGMISLYVYKKPKDTTIAFGPYLCVAGLIALFWGNTLIHWYLQFAFR